MSSATAEEQHDEYCIVLVARDPARVLMENDGKSLRLPSIAIARNARPAEEITFALQQKWAQPSLVVDWLAEADGLGPGAIVEVYQNSDAILSSAFCGIPFERIEECHLPERVVATLQRMLIGNTEGHGPFSRFAWIEDVKRWIGELAPDSSSTFTDIEQLNAGGSFALVRIGTASGKAYWLKAVGDPNAHEFATTAYLAQHCPEFLPPIVGMRGEWNAWLMEEFGQSLHHRASLATFELAVTRLASMQQLLIGKVDELLAAQFVDQRLPVLSGCIDEVVGYLEETMLHQKSTKVPVLSVSRLREIGGHLHDACALMKELNIPDSVMHNDISPGTILSDGSGCVFTDWCEAYVGNPFITFEQLCVHAKRKTSEREEWSSVLKAAYASSWSATLRKDQIDHALALAPLLSVLSYLHGRGDWIKSSRRYEDRFMSYSRSLARHMDRIASKPEIREVLCQ